MLKRTSAHKISLEKQITEYICKKQDIFVFPDEINRNDINKQIFQNYLTILIFI